MANIDDERINISASFFKVSSDNKVLMNEEYELSSIDGESIGLNFEKTSSGRFRFSTPGDTVFIGSSKLIPEFILEKAKSVETVDDIYDVFGSNDFYDIREYSGYHIVSFDIPLLIKQTKAEPGYELHNIIAQGGASFGFYFNDNELSFLMTNVSFGPFDQSSTYGGYIYDDVERIFNSESDIANFQFNKFYNEDGACMSTNAGIIITDDECYGYEYEPYGSGSYNYVPYFVENKTPVTLTIENKVNGNLKFNAYKDKELEYIITVKNTGDNTSTGNVIITFVPAGITVDTNSISDSGVYDEEAGTITWQVETLVAGVSVEFSYKATAPSNTNGEELIGYSGVMSNQLTTEVLSADTIVTLDRIIEVINNPNTGTMVYIANTNIGMPLSCLIVVTILICMMFAICIKKYKFLKK